jgi:uncharacterized membrane protein YraQ (UPF0718 family)/YHS domain-containing protein
MGKVVDGLSQGWWMFFDTFWALVFGFALSGVIQAFVTRAQMKNALGTHEPAAVAKASFFGAVSSSCSYAASALAKSIFTKGADFTASMIFMFASTNLVIELGVVLWILLGWQFALAEFIGGAVMILLLWLILPRVIPAALASKARGVRYLDMATEVTSVSWRVKIKKRTSWKSAAGFTIGDFTMMRVELLVGFVVAGLVSALIPTSWWRALFLTGHGLWSTIENAIIGPVIAFISFVCSVGNVPLAAALWHAGISFGGTISFIFADLLSLPLVMIYFKYYGRTITVRLIAVFWLVMSASGLITEGIYHLIKFSPSRDVMTMGMTHIGFNRTTFLNSVALLVCALLAWLYFSKSDFNDEFAKDLVCGMQVRTADAPAIYVHKSKTYYFCMAGCKSEFEKNPAKFIEN